MNRTIKTILGIVFIFIITFSAISICQNIGKSFKFDVTGQRLYTLSNATKTILAKLNQPVTIKLYYAKTAAMKGPDEIRYFNNYYEFVKSLLEEYATAAKGMVNLQIIDPRPFSEDELQALRYGLKRFAITEEENFFFGLAVQTQFGVEKVIPFFSPDRQNFVEYDITHLIDIAITRQKKHIGILSPLAVMGDNVSEYMARMMRMQGQEPKGPWTFVEQLRQQYEVKSVPVDVNEIKDVDILMVIHPKELSQQTQFAIDQFVLKGGRTIIFVDPYCLVDKPDKSQMQTGRPHEQSSQLNSLLQTWGVEMPAETFAGDRSLVLAASISSEQRPEKIIGFLNLAPPCFNKDNVITSELNQVRVFFSGILKTVNAADSNQANPAINKIPLLMTTSRGNKWTASPYEMSMPNPSELMKKFVDGTEPAVLAYLLTGKFKSGFPDGIEVEAASEDKKASDDKKKDAEHKKTTKKITGLKEAAESCNVIVFADVDFISDMLAYENTIFGRVTAGDNSALLLNTVDTLSGSSELISIRSRGNFSRPFTVVEEIEQQAEAETADQESQINSEIAGFQNELQNIASNAQKGQEEIVGSSILQKKKELELKIHQAQRKLRDVKMQRRQRIEHLGNVLRNVNMFSAPAIILAIAVILGVRRSTRKRYYISHTSDA